MATLKNARKQQAEEARRNTSITKRVGRDTTTVKAGTPLDHSTKHSPNEGVKFGMSKGCTKNMGDFESLRVDAWLTSEVLPGESIKEAFARVEEILDEVLEESVLSTT